MTPEYALAECFVQAAPTAFRRVDECRRFVEVVLHITSGHADALPVAQMFAADGAKTSVHFVIGQRGEVIQCVRINDIAEHAHDANAISVAVEHCARAPGTLGPDDPGLPLSEAQIQSSVALVKWLCELGGFAVIRQNVKGHKEADPKTTHDDCPEGVAGGWPWDRWCTWAVGPDVDTAPIERVEDGP